MSEARAKLSGKDEMTYVTREDDLEITDESPMSEADIEELAVREIIPISPSPMILLIKRPDYIGTAQWEFKHGKNPAFFARIDDLEWLSDFQRRKIIVPPGSALRCIVSGEVRYGYDNEVISQRHVVERVDGVLEPPPRQEGLLDFKPGPNGGH